MKRLFDITLALIGGLIALPFMVLIALAIKLDSPGRAIFAQTRLGKGGQPFTIYKFRKFPHRMGNRGANVTVMNDARMTRLGRFLERSKLDELPQLWNILKGDMSFVGPRPEIMRFADAFTGDLARVHDFLPGIFGPNQVAFRNEALLYPPDCDPEQFYRDNLLPQKARADIAYFSQNSLLSDIGWVFKGVFYSLIGAVAWRAHVRTLLPPLSLDVAMVMLAWSLANFARFEGLPNSQHWVVFVDGLWLMPLVVVPVLLLGGVYRAPARHFGFGEAVRIAYANGVGWVFAFVVMMGLMHRSLSLSLVPIAIVLSVALMILPRVLARRRYYRNNAQAAAAAGSDAVPVLIYGASPRGVGLAALLGDGFDRVQLRGFLDDDDERYRGKRVANLPVLGSERDLESIFAAQPFSEIWLSFTPNSIKHARLRHWCQQHDVRLQVLPAIGPFAQLVDDDLGLGVGAGAAASASASASAGRDGSAARGGWAVGQYRAPER